MNTIPLPTRYSPLPCPVCSEKMAKTVYPSGPGMPFGQACCQGDHPDGAGEVTVLPSDDGLRGVAGGTFDGLCDAGSRSGL